MTTITASEKEFRNRRYGADLQVGGSGSRQNGSEEGEEREEEESVAEHVERVWCWG